MQNIKKHWLGMTLLIEKMLFGFFNLIKYYFNVISVVKDTKVVRNFDFHRAHNK